VLRVSREWVCPAGGRVITSTGFLSIAVVFDGFPRGTKYRHSSAFVTGASRRPEGNAAERVIARGASLADRGRHVRRAGVGVPVSDARARWSVGAWKRGSVVDAQRFFRRVLRRGAVCFRAPVQAATRVDIEIATALRWAVSYRSGPP